MSTERKGAEPGPDGRPRCPWSLGTEDYTAYHDEEWGRPVRDADALYEKLCLEAFQSGLAWITILRKREAFRTAFAGFVPEAVSTFGDDDVARLMADAGIVRNRAKIEAAIANARAVGRMHAENESLGEMPATTPESKALARELKRRGFRFVGPTTAYAAMQACGLVDDHLRSCLARGRA